MKFFDRSKWTPAAKPVIRLEVEEKNTRLRGILVVLLLLIGLLGIVYGLFALLNTQPGWQTVEAVTDQRSCAGEFSFQYDFSDAGASASALNKQLSALYGEAAETAYMVFSPDEESADLYNLRYLNDHPNETVTVDPLLHSALALVQAYSSRSIFLGPVLDEYDRIFFSETEDHAKDADPAWDPEQRAYVAQLASYANDPAMIDVRILEDHQVCLVVAEEYLQFAQDNELDTLVEFGWLKNAFITDYFAQVLTENGFTSGYVASIDGFTRNLDTRGTAYSTNVFHRAGAEIDLVSVLEYSQPMSMVTLRDYPVYDEDVWRYYSYSSGDITTTYLDPLDGLSKTSVSTLTGYSTTASCGEIALQLAPVYISDTLDTDRLLDLKEAQIYALWCQDAQLCYTQPHAKLTLQPDQSGTDYALCYFS